MSAGSSGFFGPVDQDLERELRAGRDDLRWRYLKGKIGRVATAACLAAAAAFLGILLLDILNRGLAVVDWGFLTENVNGFRPTEGGIFNALVGSVYLMLVTMAFSVPTGVASAVYLEEFAEDTKVTRGLQRLIENLAGVPSIVFGLLGLSIFVRAFELGTSLVAGGLTLGLLVLPIVVVSTQEALAAVPDEFRDAALAMGATRWETVKDHVLPAAVPGIMTGSILSLSRALGETAPILFIAASFTKGLPGGLLDGFLALPMQIFVWVQFPSEDVQALAAGTILVLMVVLLAMNAVAVAIRQWALERRNW